MSEKILPSLPKSIDAEQAFLGALIMDSTGWEKVADKIDVNDFYDPNNKIIFRELLNLAIGDQSIDILVLQESLKRKAVLDKIGGIDYLTLLAKKVPTSAHIETYAGIIKEKSIMRQLISVSTKTIEDVHKSEEGSIKSILDKAESEIFGITSDTKTKEGLVKIGPIINEVVDILYNKKGEADHLLSGFKNVDGKIGGFQKSDLIIIAGRPSMGKTAFAMNIAQDVILSQRKKVGFFSLEMSAQQIALRMLSSLSGVSQQKLKNGDYEESTKDTKAVTSAIELMQECDFFIDETPSLNPIELRAKARRMKREHGVDMIIIDYLQLMGSMRTGNFDQNRVSEVAEITRALKALAKELDLPVIALSQLNRRAEERTDKRPHLSDLRESGSIEQDADLVIFLYRDEVYDENSEHKGKAEIRIEKHRNGPTGTVVLTFLSHCTRFEDYVPAMWDSAANDDIREKDRN